MNQYPGVIGRKLGMTQIFTEDGTVVPCTVIEARSVVVGKRTTEKDGYDALILGFGDKREKLVSRALLGQFKKANVTPKRTIREFRVAADVVSKFEVGQSVKLDEVFAVGQFVDVQGVSRGRGFTGVMVRHNFAGNVRTHGTHEYERHGGAIGTNMTPGRTLPGKRMPGQHGNKTNSVLTQAIVKIVAEDDLILIRGGVPGPTNGVVAVRGAVKKRGGKA
ncbi:MAG: 50S ribosomal protein L3 [Polyangiaceae bacterium]